MKVLLLLWIQETDSGFVEAALVLQEIERKKKLKSNHVNWGEHEDGNPPEREQTVYKRRELSTKHKEVEATEKGAKLGV